MNTPRARIRLGAVSVLGLVLAVAAPGIALPMAAADTSAAAQSEPSAASETQADPAAEQAPSAGSDAAEPGQTEGTSATTQPAAQSSSSQAATTQATTTQAAATQAPTTQAAAAEASATQAATTQTGAAQAESALVAPAQLAAQADTASAETGTVEICGTSNGPGAANTGIEYCFLAPEKVVFGQDIVIKGTRGFLASDSKTGSVINFFLDAQFSGDPNTVYSKQLFTNPATGALVTDRRTHAIVQADAQGAWTATIAWPSVATLALNSNGTGDWTQAEIDARFAVGTSHSIRLLTGSLLATPQDRQRGGSAVFTIVSSLDDEVGVSEPVYPHQTFTSEVAGDDAVAWIPVNVDSGGSLALTGTGWLTKDKQASSTVAVRLLDHTGAYYQRSSGHADPADPTVWQLVTAAENGDLTAALPLPDGIKAGSYLEVEISTTDDGTDSGDVARQWTSEALTIDETPYLPELGEDATCRAGAMDYSYELAPGMSVPAANVGGTIRLRGENWCNLVGGGSLIAVKISAGGFQHLPTATAKLWDANQRREVGECQAELCRSNKTIWYVIEADDSGSFDVNIPLPTRTNSTPAFGEGSYTLQLLTRTLSTDAYYAGTRPDPSRTVTTEEFTAVAEGVSLEGVKPGKPQATPDPLHITDDLTQATRGGVSVVQRATSWVVRVPSADPGDWVYVNVYDGPSPRFPWGREWFEVDANRQVTLPLAGVTLPTGTNKVSVQDRNAGLLGWTTVSVAAPAQEETGSSGGGTTTGTTTTSQKSSTGVLTTRPVMNLQRVAVTTTRPKPTTTPAAPEGGYDGLDETNAGGVEIADDEGTLIVTIPSVEGGYWAFLYLFTETGRTVPIGWVQVGTDHTVTVKLDNIPDGSHKLAVLTEKGTLAGWATIDGPQPLPEEEVEAASAEEPSSVVAVVQEPQAVDSDTQPDSSQTWTLILAGLGVLVLAASGAGVIVLRTPPQSTPSQSSPSQSTPPQKS